MESHGTVRFRTGCRREMPGQSIIFATIALFLICFTGARAQYVRLLPEIQDYVYRTVAVWDTTVFVSAGWSPELMFSNDQLKTVSYKPFNFPSPDGWVDCFGLTMTNASTIFMSAVKRHYVSRDTGNTWTVISPDYPNSLIFSSPTDGMFCSLGKVHFTKDAGNTWSVVNFAVPNYRCQARGIFANGNMFVTFDSKLYMSTNNGATWTDPGLPQDYFSNNLHIWGGTNAFFHTAGKIQFTSNSGVNWNVVFTPSVPVNILKVFSHDSVYAFKPSTAELILYRNQFATEEVLHRFTPGSNILDLEFASRSHLVVILGNDSLGRFAVSKDGGHTFTPVRQRQVVRPDIMKFFNHLEGSVIYDGAWGTWFIYTTDGGTTWSNDSPITNLPNYAYKRTPESLTSFLEVNDFKLLRYTHGTGYSDIFNGTVLQQRPSRVYLHSDSTYFLITDTASYPPQSKLWKSTDRGGNWSPVFKYQPGYRLHDIFLHDDSTGFAILDTNIVKIRNGGESWEGIPMFEFDKTEDIPGAYRIIRSFNDSTVYVRQNNKFFRTTNSGKNWEKYLFHDAAFLTGVIFTSPDTGYAAMAGTSPLRITTDGGRIWMRAYYPANSGSPYSMSVTDQNRIYIGTLWGLFYTDNLGGQPLGIETDESFTGVPGKFSLSQNWPNPFNPSTTVYFDLPEDSETGITVYNIMGEMVRSVPTEFRQKGRHTINFNAGDLPSGVYILTVTAGNNRASIKMVLLK